MGTLLLGAGLGLGAVGTIMQAQAQREAGEAAAAEANYQAQLAEREAKAVEQRTLYEQQKQRQAAARGLSALQAGLGASGVVTTAGAPLLLQAKQASEYELENLMIGYEGSEEAKLARAQASMQRQAAGYHKKAGRIGAMSTLITGFGGLATMAGTSMYSPTPKTPTSTGATNTTGWPTRYNW